ncbi:hypothetical protein CRENBAI_010149 [Crenichthys baileyi]|uniref:Uncharacterized protein n=1 Tax=Crenichthys baileyi TaxID=28760 RepID=A0AAV9RS39_9TELE
MEEREVGGTTEPEPPCEGAMVGENDFELVVRPKQTTVGAQQFFQSKRFGNYFGCLQQSHFKQLFKLNLMFHNLHNLSCISHGVRQHKDGNRSVEVNLEYLISRKVRILKVSLYDLNA